MPRAHRHFLPGQVWHLTHRCHEKAFLLKFARDRQRYLRWLFEAKKRFGLCVLDYMVTSNHVHLLVKDTGEGVIAQSVQLIAGRTAQEYNHRKGRQGAFWEDRYHATAIETDEHLHRCLVYIDLNMVRAGEVTHPVDWEYSGYREIQAPPQRYAIIDLVELSRLCGFADIAHFQEMHRQWAEHALAHNTSSRDDRWSQAIAVGGKAFVDNVQAGLGIKAKHRKISGAEGTYTLREPESDYEAISSAESGLLRQNNTLPWKQ
jgi:putative transposase